MSRRERILALLVVALIALFAGDQLVLQPLMSRYEQLNLAAADLEDELRRARVLIENRAAVEHRWREMNTTGLAAAPSAQRIAVQQRLTAWADDVGFNLATVSTGQTQEREGFDETRFVASGSGSLRAVAGFLAALEHGDYPLRIIESDIASRDETGGDLTLRLTLSTLRRAHDADENEQAPQPTAGQMSRQTTESRR